VDEREVTSLHRVLRRHVGREPAESISHAAGRATGDYLLARRIPRFAQWILQRLPMAWSARLLAVAIQRNAWTFTGSGRLVVQQGRLPTFVLEDCPLCRGARESRPCCTYFAATFGRLYERLVCADIVVTETECAGTGGAACRFELRLGHVERPAPSQPQRRPYPGDASRTPG
jgi:divinyl protochlorophyllide a 8-vinyl-reductase